MNNEVAKKTEFDPRDLAERLRDKIRVDMAELMPEEMWTSLLEKELKTFFEPKVRKQNHHPYDNVTIPSPFSVLVQAEVTKLVEEKITERIKVKLMAQVDKATGKIDTAVMDFVKANIGELLKAWMGNAVMGQLAMAASSINLQVDMTQTNQYGQKIDNFGNVIG